MTRLPLSQANAEQAARARQEIQAETADMATLCLHLCNPDQHARYRLAPGQFNMLYRAEERDLVLLTGGLAGHRPPGGGYTLK